MTETARSFGAVLAGMSQRVRPPGTPERTRFVWKRCSEPCGFCETGECQSRGPVFLCGPCLDRDHVTQGLTIVGPLENPLDVVCDRCGAQGNEAMRYDDASYDPWRKIPGHMYFNPKTGEAEEYLP